MSGAHSVFQTCMALSVSEGSILMWMSRMIDIGYPPDYVMRQRLAGVLVLRAITVAGVVGMLDLRVSASGPKAAIVNYFFLPVTSSHFSPRSFLISSTFFQALSFIWRNTARAAA